MHNDPDSYDAGYRQALIDVAQFIQQLPNPEIEDTDHMDGFWTVLAAARDTKINRFHMVVAGYRIAKKILCERIISLSKKI